MAWLAVEFQIAAKRLAAIREPAQPGAAIGLASPAPLSRMRSTTPSVGFLELESAPPCRLN